MRLDNRLSRLLHVLLHMAELDRPVTSDVIGAMLETNPALVRRTMAGLRQAGYVVSEKGHGGGWVLARPLAEITLRDVYEALGRPALFAFGIANPAARCLVEQAVNAAVGDAVAEVERALLDRFGSIHLSEIDADFRRRLAERGEVAVVCGVPAGGGRADTA